MKKILTLSPKKTTKKDKGGKETKKDPK